MSDPKAFDRILTEIIRQDKGISKVILVDKTGLTIANVSKLSYYPVDVDSIGAIASAVFCASEEQGKNLQIGELEIVTSEFSEGKIFASACGKGVLCVVSGPEVNIGLIRLVMKKQGVQLADELNKFLAVEPTAPTKDELDEEDLKSALAELERV
ncbi:MAG: roadblock/LC7 domain-containing protein [Candidatus Thorarchaeota archaeon]|nr:MAG: roadblock/LC7 domain-containing protein [Candidatus Thorarchaeota archaeon]